MTTESCCNKGAMASYQRFWIRRTRDSILGKVKATVHLYSATMPPQRRCRNTQIQRIASATAQARAHRLWPYSGTEIQSGV